MSSSYGYTTTSTHGKFLQRLITANQDADRYFSDTMAMFVQMLDGDGSQDAHYATITTKFGFPDTTTAHNAYNELQSAFGKTSGNGSVSSVKAARDQLYARLTA